MRRLSFFGLVLVLPALAARPAIAQNASSSSPAAAPDATTDAASATLGLERIRAMLKSGQADEAWFTPGFLQQIPITEVNSLITQILADAGAFKSIEAGAAPGTFKVRYVKATQVVQIKFAGKLIDYLLFKPLE